MIILAMSEKMSINEKVASKIKRIPEGEVFTSQDFSFIENENAVALALSRLVKKEVIKRLAKGMYYKPKSSKYGVLKPTENEILKKILKKKNEGYYISGISSFNKLGLTTQVPSTIEIFGDTTSRERKIGNVRIRYVNINDKGKPGDAEYLQILDSLRLIKKIPDSNVNDSYRTLKYRIGKLDEVKINKLYELSIDKKPIVRALLGSMIEDNFSNISNRIKKTLNNLTTFKIGLTIDAVPNRDYWKIR